MRIPLGEFGNSVAAPVAPPSREGISQGIANLGNAVTKIGIDQAARNEEFAKTKDANKLLDYQLGVKNLARDFQDKIATQQLHYDDAQKEWSTAVAKIPRPTATANSRDHAENLNRAADRVLVGSGAEIGTFADAARNQDRKAQGLMMVDKLTDLGGIPGADIESINSQLDVGARAALASSGEHPAVTDQVIKNAQEKNWTNQAVNRMQLSRDNLDGLKKLESELSDKDGYYIDKLDPTKRNALLGSVIGYRTTLENRLLHQSDKRDAIAERAVNEYARQQAKGLPATPEMLNEWANVTKGTAFESDFKDLINSEKEIQQVLRLPAQDQIKYAQDKRAEIDKGGNLKQEANVSRLEQTIKENVNLLNTAPIIYSANRNGTAVKPMDVQDLVSNPAAVKSEMENRVTTIMAERKQQGYNVPMRPLVPQEVTMLSGALNRSGAEDQRKILASLFNSSPTTEAYMGAMAQLAPDAPVKAQAGMLAAKDAELKTTHWFKPNTAMPSQKVAETMLRGEEILNPPKDAKAQDGKPKLGLYLPVEAETQLQSEFAKEVGESYQLASNVGQADYQAVKAYYVGKLAGPGGHMAADKMDVDTNIVKEAVRNVVGNVTDYNGRGKVIIPWGMDESTFNNRVKAALGNEAQRRGMDPFVMSQLPMMGLVRLKGGGYMFTNENSILEDPKTGEKIVIDISKPMKVGTRPVVHGRGVTGVEDVIE